MGTMAGYEAMQRGAGRGGADDASPTAAVEDREEGEGTNWAGWAGWAGWGDPAQDHGNSSGGDRSGGGMADGGNVGGDSGGGGSDIGDVGDFFDGF